MVFNGYESVDVGLPYLVVDLDELTLPVSRKGKLLKGDRPVVLLLHGMHSWAYDGDEPMKPAPPINKTFSINYILFKYLF